MVPFAVEEHHFGDIAFLTSLSLAEKVKLLTIFNKSFSADALDISLTVAKKFLNAILAGDLVSTLEPAVLVDTLITIIDVRNQLDHGSKTLRSLTSQLFRQALLNKVPTSLFEKNLSWITSNMIRNFNPTQFFEGLDLDYLRTLIPLCCENWKDLDWNRYGSWFFALLRHLFTQEGETLANTRVLELLLAKTPYPKSLIFLKRFEEEFTFILKFVNDHEQLIWSNVPKPEMPPELGPYGQYHGTWLKVAQCAALFDLERRIGQPIDDPIQDIENDPRFQNEFGELELNGEGDGPWDNLTFGFVPFGREPEEPGQPFVQYLGVADRGLSELPISIGNFSRLECLHLEKNKCSFVPDTIGNLTHLKFLSLGSNPLKNVPDTIGNLRSLKALNLECTHLNSLPVTIGKCQMLESLSLGNTLLKNLPESIGDLQSLIRLDLGSPHLKRLPATLGNLHKLSILYLDTPLLTDLPETIKKIDSLETLVLPETVAVKNREIIKEIPNLKTLNRLHSRF